MSDFLEILQVYLVYAFPWPGMFVTWAIHDGGLSYLGLWAGVGFPVAYLLYRHSGRGLILAWVIFWLMPGTIICGDATVWPWAFTLYVAFQDGGCSTPVSLGITLTANTLIVLSLRAVARRFLRRRLDPRL